MGRNTIVLLIDFTEIKYVFGKSNQTDQFDWLDYILEHKKNVTHMYHKN